MKRDGFLKQMTRACYRTAVILPFVWFGMVLIAPGSEAQTMDFAGDRLFALPGKVVAFALKDLNGDGRGDLFAAVDRQAALSDGFAVLPGLEGSRFGPAQYQNMGLNGVVDGVAEDFNWDGLPDVAILTTGGKLLLFVNRTVVGATEFIFKRTQQVQPGSTNHLALWPGRLDGDSGIDLFTWRPSPPELLRFRNTTAKVGTAPLFSQEERFVPGGTSYVKPLAVKDFSGDGLSDLALLRGDTVGATHELEVYLATDAGGQESSAYVLSSTASLSAYPERIVAGRLDEDERVDLLVATDFSRRLEIFRGVVASASPFGAVFEAALVLDASGLRNVSRVDLWDLNGDGRPDVLDPQPETLFQVDPPPGPPLAFEATAQPALPPGLFDVGDLNADSLSDLVGVLDAPAFAGVFHAASGGDARRPQFGTQNHLDLGAGERRVAAGDFDGDDRSDLAVAMIPAGSTDCRVVIMRSLPVGGFESLGEIQIEGRVERLAWLELTGDALPELAVLASAEGAIRIYRGDTEEPFEELFSASTAERPRHWLFADFDDDERLDLVITHEGSFTTGQPARIALWAGAGNGAFLPVSSQVFPSDPSHVRLRRPLDWDFNGDGNRDLAVLNTTQGGDPDGYLLLGDGRLDLAEYVLQPFFLEQERNALDFAVFDLDANGIADLAFLLEDGFGIARGGGEDDRWDGTFGPLEHFSSGRERLLARMAKVDLQGEGEIDFVLGENRAITLRASRNGGGEQDYAEAIHYAGGEEFAFGDFNGDGETDLATVDTRFLRILLRQAGGTPPPTPSATPTLTPTLTPTMTVTGSPTPSPSTTPTPTRVLQADFDDSHRVDSNDLLQLLRDWRYPPTPPPVSDLDRDFESSPGDLFLFQSEWQEEL